MMKFLFFLFSTTLAYTQDHVEIDLRSSSLQLKSEASGTLSKKLNNPTRFEIFTSNWSPSNFKMDSRIPHASAFEATATPPLSFHFLAQPWNNPTWGAFTLKIGGGFSHLKRYGFLPETLSNIPSEQSLLILTGRLGIEFIPSLLQTKYVSLHTCLSMLPALLLTERSVFDSGISATGVLGQIEIGLISNLKWISQALDLELNIEFFSTYGSLNQGNLFGTGIGAGIRIPI